MTKQSPHPYYLKIRPCNAHVDRHRWEILDNEGLLQTSADSFATEREAKDNGRLEMQGLIEMWHDRDISAGTEWEQEIIKHLNKAQIILLLVSPDFMNSDYCYSTEMTRAIEKHEHKEARVIPIILRPVIWQQSPFGKIQALPADGKPITSAGWHSTDEALYDTAEGIRKVVEKMTPSVGEH